MNINKLFSDKDFLEKEIKFFESKKQIRKITENKELVKSHLKKARHNLKFFKLNKERNEFNDWLIVALYYSLYHSALALITNKKYYSKNHYATILLLIKEYRIDKEDIELINELSIDKEDAELYTSLKDERHQASNSTETLFSKNKIIEYEDKVLEFINKTEEIVS